MLRRLRVGLWRRLFMPVLVDGDERADAGHAWDAWNADAACAAGQRRQPVSNVLVSAWADVLPVVWQDAFRRDARCGPEDSRRVLSLPLLAECVFDRFIGPLAGRLGREVRPRSFE